MSDDGHGVGDVYDVYDEVDDHHIMFRPGCK